MKTFFIASLLFLSASFTVTAQNRMAEYNNYDWAKNPTMHTVTVDEQKLNAVGEIYKIMREYIYNSNNELDLYVTKHQCVHVNNDDAIEQFNKVYVPYALNESIISVKARTITPDGKVKEVNQSSMKELENVADKSSYKIFALEGVDKGSEVEYLYTIKIKPSIYGAEYLQDDYPKKNIEYSIISPSNLAFKTKSYNGLAQAVTDTSLKEKNYLRVFSDGIPMLYKEDYAVYTANLQRVEYKLAYNYASSKVELYDWPKASDIFWTAYDVTDMKLLSEAKKFVSKQQIPYSDDENKLIAIDNYLKNNISIQDAEADELADIKKIITNKVANEEGMIKLYTAILNALEISYELVVTSSREYARFDGDFQSWSFLDHFLIHVPSVDLWLVPTDADMRNGMIPDMWSANDGLFIKKISVGAVTSGIGKVKYIPAVTTEMSHHNTFATIFFDGNFDEIKLHLTQNVAGYHAAFQPYYSYFSDDKKKEIQNDYLKAIGVDAVLSNVKVTDHLLDTTKYHSLIFDADVTINSLVEHAGNRYLFKIGNLLGEQSQLYNEKPRLSPVDIQSESVYHRELIFTIPDGYKISNLDDLKLDFEVIDNGKTDTYFHSNYKMEGSKVTVSIIENYGQIHYPLSKYEEFKKVINAAADFNKVVLIMEKTN